VPDPDPRERSGAPEAPSEGTRPAEDAGAVLPRPIQEHLGQQLRTTYNAEAPEKPAYLGDTALPLEFELQLQRLEASERRRLREMAHELGTQAVEQALRDLLSAQAVEQALRDFKSG
jgi:hypothetical protein